MYDDTDCCIFKRRCLYPKCVESSYQKKKKRQSVKWWGERNIEKKKNHRKVTPDGYWYVKKYPISIVIGAMKINVIK